MEEGSKRTYINIRRPAALGSHRYWVDQRWLKADLQLLPRNGAGFLRAVLSGVCSVDFGHNVIEPLPIPEFAGHFVPNTQVQRLGSVWQEEAMAG